MRIFKMIDQRLLKRWPRYRLYRICKAIGIKPNWWQKKLALGEIDFIPPEVRKQWGSGKTTGVMLRVLMIPQNNYMAWTLAGRYLLMDPGCVEGHLRWYSREYRRLKNLCLDAGIPVIQAEVYRMVMEAKRRFL